MNPPQIYILPPPICSYSSLNTAATWNHVKTQVRAWNVSALNPPMTPISFKVK